MHADFADWYRIASLDLQDIDLESRWATLEAFTKKASWEDLLNAGRLFFGLPLKGAEFVDAFVSRFKAADSKFRMVDNNVEVSILAGSALVAALALKDDRSLLAGLLSKCCSFGGQRSAPAEDIVRLAKEHLSNASASLRNAEQGRLPLVSKMRAELDAAVSAVKKALESGNLPATAEPMSGALTTFSKALSAVVEWAGSQEEQQEMRREESDILWWIFASRSRDLDLPFSEVPRAALCSVAPKELAELTRAFPGPYSARAFLAKVIAMGKLNAGKGATRTGGESLAESVEQCREEWRRTVAENTMFAPVLDMCPAHAAILRCEESGGKTSWRQVFRNVIGLNPTARVGGLSIAEQAYDEWMLAKLLDSLSG